MERQLSKAGRITPNSPGKKKTTYSVRIVPDGSFASETYPGFNDHPSTQEGVEYSRSVLTDPTATVWEALSNDLYANGGWPIWLYEATSESDRHVFTFITHAQRVWDGRCNYSVRTMSRFLPMHYTSVQRSLRWLVKIGLIVCIRKHSGRSPNWYRIVLPSSLEPRTLPNRRNDNGFTGERNSVETSAQNLETSAQTRSDHRAEVQKTKPLKGVVGAVGASAPSATTTQKTKDIPTPDLLTIDQQKRNSKQKKRVQNIPPKIGLVRKFHDWEVTDDRLEEWIESSPSLRTAFDTCSSVALVAGGVDQGSGAVVPHTLASQSQILAFIRTQLTQGLHDVTNPIRAIERVLKSLTDKLTPLQISTEQQHQKWQQQEDDRIKREEFARMTPWEQARFKARGIRSSRLITLTSERGSFPQLREYIQGWMHQDSKFEMKPWEISSALLKSNYEMLTETLAKAFGHGEWGGLTTLTQSRLLQAWLVCGGDHDQLVQQIHAFEDSDELKQELDWIASRPF